MFHRFPLVVGEDYLAVLVYLDSGSEEHGFQDVVDAAFEEVLYLFGAVGDEACVVSVDELDHVLQVLAGELSEAEAPNVVEVVGCEHLHEFGASHGVVPVSFFQGVWLPGFGVRLFLFLGIGFMDWGILLVDYLLS